MSYFLSALPLWALILAVVIVPTSVAVGVQVFVRRAVGVEKLALNNEVAGFIFAIIGVVYAVLLAFVVIAVWEKFSEGQTSVAKSLPPPLRCSTTPRARSQKPPSSTIALLIILHLRSKTTGLQWAPSPRTARRRTRWACFTARPWRSIARARAAQLTCRKSSPKLIT